MTLLLSKRHPIKFYLILIVTSLIGFYIGTASLLLFLMMFIDSDFRWIIYFTPVLGIATYWMTYCSVYLYYKNAPIIQINSSSISFNKETFLLTDLKHIEFTGKKSFSFFFSYDMESAELQFGNGQIKYIYDSMYQNAWEIKMFLKQVIVDKTNVALQRTQPIDEATIVNQWFDIFKGNQFLSLQGISLWLILGTIAYTLVISDYSITDWQLVFFVFGACYWFFFFSWQMHYFKASEHYLVVKNHNLIWMNRAYRLTDIYEIVFETRGQLPNCLRIITKDFRTTLYPAGTLRDKTWLEFKAKLESQNIIVRNECIF